MSVSREAIARAAQRIAPHVRRTPVIDVAVEGVALPVTLKLELLQHSGSFKARGAFNNLLGASGDGPVATASGGNHGAAVAYAASRLGRKATIFVPDVASPAKVARIAAYGAAIVQKGATYAEALALCDAHIAETGALGIHAYDAAATLEGQGTLARELEDQAPGLDTLLVAVGGGGLIGGIAAWHRSAVKLVGVEPFTCDALHAAMAAGRRVAVQPSGLAVDSLGAATVGALMFDIARDHVASVALVSDDDIRAAQAWLWRNLQIIAEPGGAAAFAALLSGAYRPAPDERLGVVVCGANTPLDTVSRLLG